MKKAVHEPIRRWWAGEGGTLGALLTPVSLPLALVFGTGVRLRNLLYDRGVLVANTAPVPIVSVGNLSVGGTGKTPVARWLVERLLSRGHRPAVLTRGYGRDEILLHRRWHPDVPVIVDRDRGRGARSAQDQGVDVCVLDDGFQHRRLARDLDLALVSPADPTPVRLLPRGPYREPLSSLRRADLILVPHRTRDQASGARSLALELGGREGFPPAVPFAFGPGPWSSLRGDEAPAPAGPCWVITAVAHPEGVARLAGEAGAQVEGALNFPDHHEYGAADVERIRNAAGDCTVVTTEKDAVKLAAFQDRLGDVRVLPLEARPSAAVERAVDQALNRVLGPAGRPRRESRAKPDPMKGEPRS
jgi:tetraacyldisaccharide 4'-kinase